MSNKWVSFSPHISSKNSTTRIYLLMMICLAPVVASAVVSFSILPLITIAICMISAFLTDMIFQFIVNKKFNFTEISSLFIGLIIGLAMPTGVPAYIPIVGVVFSIVFIRNMAGGIGKNFVSEIAVAVILSYLIFTKGFCLYHTGETLSSISFLDKIIAGEVSSINIEQLLFGGFAGTVAESSVFWLMIAGLVLICFKIIDFKVPVAVVISTFVFAWLFFDAATAVNLLCAGGVLLVAFFVATDYAVVPINKWGKIVYGLAVGFVTVLIWKYANAKMATYIAVIIVGLFSSMLKGISKTLLNRRV